MRKLMLMFAVLAASLLAAQTAAPPKQEASPLKVNVGDVAPDFTLKVYDGKQMSDVSLAQFRGKKNVILAFFVFAFTGGWTQQMQNLQKQMAELEGTDTQVLGVSMDSPFANKAFADSIGVTFPIASDWFNGGAATKAFGGYNERTRAARRVNYLIDKSGKVAEMQVDSEAIDPTKIVNACKARRLKE